jgi:predicted acetylornithine/succinylornithine family transaminase
MPLTFSAPPEEQVELPERTFLMGNYKPASVHFVRGSGSELFDDTGRRYLDLLSGIAVTSLGHAHPAVAGAIADQARRLLHVSNLYRNGLAEDVARRLDMLVGDGAEAGGKVFFANSGAEANECAIKLARRFGGRGRHTVVSAYGSFHGRTLATLHATGQPAKHEAFAPLPEGFRHVAFGDVDALDTALDPSVVSGLLLEVIEGENGVVPSPPGYLARARELCSERGILLMLDEIQTGLGRTGRWFAFQREGVVPDVVTMAKALGNGVPVGACWARADVAEVFRPGDHGSTFGGQPLAMSAARATLRTMIEMDAPAVTTKMGEYLAASVAALDGVVSVRGEGLLRAAVLEEGLDAAAVTSEALRRGLIINAPVPGVLRFAPPYIITEHDIDQAVTILKTVLDDALAERAEKGH